MEILFTGLHSLKNHEHTLQARTSIWMFPIYGAACLIRPISALLGRRNVLIRGSVYTFLIFTGEYISGSILRKLHACPWDYSSSRYNINGLIRLDYAPCWFAAGLVFEKYCNMV